MVDWSKPIEAVHEDGRVGKVNVTSDRRDDYILVQMHEEFFTYFSRKTGAPRYLECGWRIRNVEPATPAPKYPQALVKRMVEAGKELAGAAIVLSAANDFRDELSSERSRVSEAIRGWMKAVAELPAEVDVDTQEAERIAYELEGGLPRDLVVAGIKAGRILETSDRITAMRNMREATRRAEEK